MNELPKDGHKLLTDLEVLPGVANSRQLKIKWQWSSTLQAKELLHQAKIFYFNEVDIENPGNNIPLDPEATELTLQDLRPDTKYTICLQITRRKFGKKDNPNRPPPDFNAGPIDMMKPMKTYQQQHQQQVHRLATKLTTPHEYITEMECRVAITQLVHWPALICSAVGILLAFLISLTIYLVLKSQKSKQNSSEKTPTSRFCKIHSRSFHVNPKTQNDFDSGSHSCSNKHSRHSVHHHHHHHPLQKHSKADPIEHSQNDTSGLRRPCLKVDKAKIISDQSSPSIHPISDPKPLHTETSRKSNKIDSEPSQLICLDVIHTECTSSASGLDSYPFSSTTSIVDSHPDDGAHSSYTSGNSPSPLITCCSEANETGRDQNQLTLERFGNFKRTVSFVDQTSRHMSGPAAGIPNLLEVHSRTPNKSRDEFGNHRHRDKEPALVTEGNKQLSCTLIIPCPTSLSNQEPMIPKQSADEYACDENSPIPESVKQPDVTSMYDPKLISCKDMLQSTIETLSSIDDSQVMSPLLKEQDNGLRSTGLCQAQASRTIAQGDPIQDPEPIGIARAEETSPVCDVKPDLQTKSDLGSCDTKAPNLNEAQLDSLYMPKSGHDFIDQTESSSIFHTQLIETL